MKYRILVAVACVVLAAVILLLLPPAQPQGPTPTEPSHSVGSTTQPTNPTTVPPADPGVVRLYSCNETWRATLETLAAQYTYLTGAEVLVLGPQADDCQQTLSQLMKSEAPPTVLCVHSQSQLESWQESLLDLKETDLAATLCADSFGLYLDGKLMAVPMELGAFGLLVNAELLGTKGALSRNDITDSQSLAMAVQILKNNSVKAFPTAQVDTLAALYLSQTEDTVQIRSFLDLYAANCHASGNAHELFLGGQCAFFLGGTWNYSQFAAQGEQALQLRNLDILPTYTAGAMQYFLSTAWCVNGSARQEDVDATLQFLVWLVSAGDGTAAPIDALQTLTPFADGAWYGNHLEKKLLGYRKTDSAVVHWVPDAGDHTKLMVALQIYMQNGTDENWSLLQSILNQITNKP